jgi:imidazole glycerol-phosphate synthase subunit HisH
MKIGIVDFGAGNLGNVINALRHCGIESECLAEGKSYDGLVLPGVGSFDPAVRSLRRSGADAVIHGHVSSGRPLLGICLGMQLLCRSSEEGTETGLGYFTAKVVKIPKSELKVPNMGWSRLEAVKAGRLDTVGAMYFVHSYYVPMMTETTVAITYGIEMSAVIENSNIFGVQFHPERSGEPGLQLLRSFGEMCR